MKIPDGLINKVVPAFKIIPGAYLYRITHIL